MATKRIDKKTADKIIGGNYMITDLKTGEVVTPKFVRNSSKRTVSSNKEFIKKWTDRRLNKAIKQGLTLLDKELLLDIMDYIDSYNEINFNALSTDMKYSASKMCKQKKRLVDKGLIRKKGKCFYLNPIVGIKSRYIDNELIELFKEEFDKYSKLFKGE